MKHTPNKLVVSVSCDAVTGEDDLEMYPGNVIVPEKIVAEFTAETEYGAWSVDVFVLGRSRLTRGGLSKTVHSRPFWARGGEGSLESAPEWVRAWVSAHTPPLNLIPEWVR